MHVLLKKKKRSIPSNLGFVRLELDKLSTLQSLAKLAKMRLALPLAKKKL
jgi:hypothetical protein